MVVLWLFENRYNKLTATIRLQQCNFHLAVTSIASALSPFPIGFRLASTFFLCLQQTNSFIPSFPDPKPNCDCITIVKIIVFIQRIKLHIYFGFNSCSTFDTTNSVLPVPISSCASTSSVYSVFSSTSLLSPM